MAFHPYPQLIPQVFNPGGFGPPLRLTVASSWPWVAHAVSGLVHATTGLAAHALFRLAFASAPGVNPLTLPQRSNSPAHSTKGTQSHIPVNRHSALTVCKHTVSGTISLPYRGTFHHSLTVLSAIGHQEYLALPNGLGRFPRDFACPVVLGKSSRRSPAFVYGAVTLCGRPFQGRSTKQRFCNSLLPRQG